MNEEFAERVQRIVEIGADQQVFQIKGIFCIGIIGFLGKTKELGDYPEAELRQADAAVAIHDVIAKTTVQRVIATATKHEVTAEFTA